MFGIGLIALMLYSGIILKETDPPSQYLGALILTIGTLIFGFDGIFRPKMTMAGVDLTVAGIVLAASFLLGRDSFSFAIPGEERADAPGARLSACSSDFPPALIPS